MYGCENYAVPRANTVPTLENKLFPLADGDYAVWRQDYENKCWNWEPSTSRCWHVAIFQRNVTITETFICCVLPQHLLVAEDPHSYTLSARAPVMPWLRCNEWYMLRSDTVCLCVRTHVQINEPNEYNISLLKLALYEQHTASQLYNFINIVGYLLCTVLSSSVYTRETDSLALRCKCCVLSNQRIKCIPLLVACFMPHLSIRFVVDKVALGHFFPRSTPVYPTNQHSIREILGFRTLSIILVLKTN
jgi:hypothetical protein